MVYIFNFFNFSYSKASAFSVFDWHNKRAVACIRGQGCGPHLEITIIACHGLVNGNNL
jgi:hypothetical protein